MPKAFTDWVRDCYPEVRLGSLIAVTLSLAFPPYAIDTSSGSTTYLGCHSLFTQEAGYVCLSRLVPFWLLVAATALFTQLNGQRCSIGLPPRREMFFGRTDGAVPLEGTTLLAVILAIPLWLFLLGLMLGRERVLGLESHLAYFACAAFQLVVLSRLLLWLSREQTNLVFGYLILCAASLAWDLRTSPAPQARVGGLVPLYALLGYLLYRFDLRFVANPIRGGTSPAPGPAGGPVTNLVTNPSVSSTPSAEHSPTQPSGPPSSASVPPSPPSSAVLSPAPDDQAPVPVAVPPTLEPEDEPIPESEAFSPNSANDPYDRYRPGR